MKLTESQARALRVIAKKCGMITVDDPKIVMALHELISTQYCAISITSAGYDALATYDQFETDHDGRSRIARGMSEAGRAALSAEKGERDVG